MIYRAYYDSPVGKIMLAAREDKLIGAWIEGQKYFAGKIKEKMIDGSECKVLQDAVCWLSEYFDGKQPEIERLAIAPEGSDFARSVWERLSQIPYGETVTYGEIAKEIAEQHGISRMSAQAVGGAVGHNPLSIIVPCHRVIGANGDLTGYAGGIEIKRKLLEHEGFIRR